MQIQASYGLKPQLVSLGFKGRTVYIANRQDFIASVEKNFKIREKDSNRITGPLRQLDKVVKQQPGSFPIVELKMKDGKFAPTVILTKNSKPIEVKFRDPDLSFEPDLEQFADQVSQIVGRIRRNNGFKPEAVHSKPPVRRYSLGGLWRAVRRRA